MANVINATSTGNGGLVSTGDDSGILNIQTNETTAITVDASQNTTFAGKVTSAGALTLASNGTTTAVTIDTSQNVGIGTTNPDFGSYGAGERILGVSNPTSGTRARLSFQNLSTGTSGISGTLAFFNGSTILGSIDVGADGATNKGYYAFYNNNGTSNSERMRIDSSGNLLVGTTSTSSPASGTSINMNSGGSFQDIGHANGTGSGTRYAGYIYNTTLIGSITQNGTTGVLYNLTSDYRLKNNTVALTGAKDFVMALQPKTWDWWDNSGKGVGFIAHEFMEVAKYSGQGEKDAVDADGKPIHQSIQPSSSEVMANIVALMQEQQALITAQAAEIAELKAKVA